MVGTVDALEDEFSDVISKAQRGLALTTADLAAQAGLDATQARGLRAGQWDPAILRAIAGPLGLRAEGLLELAEGRFRPDASPPAGMLALDMAAPTAGYEAMRVNAFLVQRPGGKEAVLFDTGTDATVVLEALRAEGTSLAAIFLTHAHWDHYEALEELRAACPEAVVYGPGNRRLGPHSILRGGEILELAGLRIEARSTPGHADPSLSFIVHGLAVPVAVVGDALFAGSVGGIPPPAYTAALAAIRDQLLALPGETVVAPGHGCLTTVAYEREHNPFFPA